MGDLRFFVPLLGVFGAHCAPKGTDAAVDHTPAAAATVADVPRAFPPGDAGSDDADLVLLVDAEYGISHGWGHVYRCRVRQVLRGRLDQTSISVSVYATVDLYGELLRYPTPEYAGLTLSFRRRPDLAYGPPPGFRDEAGTFWELIGVSGPAAAADTLDATQENQPQQ